MNWDALDYVAAFLLLGGGVAAYLVMRRLVKGRLARMLLWLVIAAGIALIWTQLAVGIF